MFFLTVIIFFSYFFWKSQQLKEAVQIHFLIVNKSAIGVMELISSTLRRYKKRKELVQGSMNLESSFVDF